MTKHFCDKCGAELPVGVTNNVKIGLTVHFEDGGPFEGPFDSWKVINYDICQSCAEEIAESITGFKPTPVL